jgi:hypothetical protein
MSELLINQSLVKDLVKYQKNELCGLIFNNKWILHQYGKGSTANNLGHFFEYLCTGALAKGETNAPKADFTKKGEMTADFQVAQKQAVYFKEVIQKYGIKLISAGDKVVADGKWVGTLDIEAEWNGIYEKSDFLTPDPLNPNNRVIIDLKYSGLLEDKWSPFGWHTDTLSKKEGTMLQAKHYKFLFWKKYGFNPPFFFFVFDSKNVGVCKIIYVDIDDYELEQHEIFLNKAKAYLERQLDIGFKPIPTYDSCQNCAYNQWCHFKVETPPIITIKPE